MKYQIPKLAAMLALPALLALNSELSTVMAQSNVFTYQGQLLSNGSPANGNYAMIFNYCGDSSGSNYLASVTNSSVTVDDGSFLAQLADPYNIQERGFSNLTYLEIEVAPAGGTNFATLSPRQLLTPTPYAFSALNASNVVGTVKASQITGTFGNNQLASNYITINPGPGLGGGGPVNLGGATTLSNIGVTSLSGNSDITVSAPNGAVTLGTDATSANNANTIVKRDASGNFSAATITAANFSGNGSGLTGVAAQYLATGVAVGRGLATRPPARMPSSVAAWGTVLRATTPLWAAE